METESTTTHRMERSQFMDGALRCFHSHGLTQTAIQGCEQHTSHVTIFRTMTRTCVAQVVSLACAHHIPCVISMRSCCVFDSLRLLHFPLLAVHLLSYRLPRCGWTNSLCTSANEDLGTLGEYDPLTKGVL